MVIPVIATPILAINGRCDARSQWGSRPDCICIDHNVCTNKYRGYAVQGSPGNWPCPRDGANVWGCMVGRPCVTRDSYCGWRSVCTGTGPYAGRISSFRPALLIDCEPIGCKTLCFICRQWSSARRGFKEHYHYHFDNPEALNSLSLGQMMNETLYSSLDNSGQIACRGPPLPSNFSRFGGFSVDNENFHFIPMPRECTGFKKEMKHGQQNLPHAENDRAKIAVLISASSPPKILNGISQTSISRRCSMGVYQTSRAETHHSGPDEGIPSSVCATPNHSVSPDSCFEGHCGQSIDESCCSSPANIIIMGVS
ncbi:hypothetical protein PAAG_06113 [Paracoccidioides lutzii Pb01]|uniref:Uncharacterized protein n=1 Tax=Paracoccidioides lutzii (strain ATCC MYA-826 / Pb01) TaxID=502779 RepID=C1H603_PARBA|nr:hypothetical protein PAAG_06113 [Paracoccidioides lutzii Pb01]EEH35066.2 hypothetical protein PAAG_06113 [Paracoccidioides lutzii Pb01]